MYQETKILFIQCQMSATWSLKFRGAHGSVGRALDWGLKGCYFKTYRRRSHWIWSLSKTLFPLHSTGSNCPDMTEKLLTGTYSIDISGGGENAVPYSLIVYSFKLMLCMLGIIFHAFVDLC